MRIKTAAIAFGLILITAPVSAMCGQGDSGAACGTSPTGEQIDEFNRYSEDRPCPPLSVSAAKIAKDFEKYKLKASWVYHRKLLVSGLVESVDEVNGIVMVNIAPNPLPDVTCFWHEDQAPHLHVGDSVSIQADEANPHELLEWPNACVGAFLDNCQLK
jgi:hypothetical protein